MKSRIAKTEYTFETHSTGTMAWFKNGMYHRDNDLPAIILSGNMYWFKNGNFIKSIRI
jgi:hypothetical protein